MFKEFGIRLNFTPTVLSGDLINLKVKPEVSSLDFANGVSLSGFRVPALSTRRTETEVELQDGQTFAIAGLMNNTVTSTMSKIPGIGDIPVLGYLFKSRAYQKAQTELVVMITPQIVRRGSTGVSQGLPTAVEPYLAPVAKPLPQPSPYVGSPRYPVTDPGQQGQGSPKRDDAPEAQAAQPKATPAPAQTAPVQTAPAMQSAPRPAPPAAATPTPAPEQVQSAAKPSAAVPSSQAPVVAAAPQPAAAATAKKHDAAVETPKKTEKAANSRAEG